MTSTLTVSSRDAGVTCRPAILHTRRDSSIRPAASFGEESSSNNPILASSPFGHGTHTSTIPQAHSAGYGTSVVFIVVDLILS